MLTLDTMGGDAWTFSKQIGGALAGVCDDVLVRTGDVSIRASVYGDRFAATTPLRSGPNEVHAECYRGGRIVALSGKQAWRAPLPEVPKAWIRLRTTPKSIWVDAGASELAPGSPTPIVRFEWSARSGNPEPLFETQNGAELEGVARERVELVAPVLEGEYYIELRATDALGRSDKSTAVFEVEAGAPREIDLADEHPRWVDSAVVYGAAPFFFGPAGFDGVRERLDEIAALGATALWLSPITETAPGDFGYAVTDHFRLRETFGGEAEFRKLIDAAHALGLRVIMDFVPNHVSERHRYYLDAQRSAERSAYYRWFERDDEGEATHYFDWENLKNLDYDNPEVQNHVIAAFAHWVREFGIDGFRVDASWAVRERAPEFWPRWREELKRIDPDLLLLAEASARDPYYVANGFDAAYDWTDNLGEWAWRDVFEDGGSDVDLRRLRAALTNHGAGFPSDTMTFRFINNNDTGPRFITRHGVARTRLAAILLFTLPGLPLIYNGDEVGAEFEPYDEGPPIEWRDVHGFTPLYTRLAHLRRDTPALTSRALSLLTTNHEKDVLAYKRAGATPDDDLIVVLNFGSRRRQVRLLDADLLRRLEASNALENLLTGERMKLEARDGAIPLPSNEGVILRMRRSD